jgi:hypothetical protein
MRTRACSSREIADVDPELADYLRIEGRELEAGGLNEAKLLTHLLLPAHNRAPCGQIGGTGWKYASTSY